MTKSSFLLSLTIVFAVIVQGQAPKNKVVMVGEDGIRRSAIKTVMPVYPERSQILVNIDKHLRRLGCE